MRLYHSILITILLIGTTCSCLESINEDFEVLEQEHNDKVISLIDWAEKEKIIDNWQRNQMVNEFKKEKYQLMYGREERGERLENEEKFYHPLTSRLTLLNVLYFGGGLLVIGSMTLFMTLGWESFGGLGLFVISTCYSVIFGSIGVSLWKEEEYKVLSGILCSISTSMVPLATYGIQKHLGFWVTGNFQDYNIWIRGSWVPMDMMTAITGLMFLRYIQFPFLLAPVSGGLFFLSMDLTPIIFQRTFTMKERAMVSTFFGLGMVFFGRFIESKYGTEPDFGFWLYLFGLIAFWMGLTYLNGLSSFIFFGSNVALLLYGRLFERNTFIFFSACGIASSYFTSMEHFFRNSLTTSNGNDTHGSKGFLSYLFRIILVSVVGSQVLVHGYFIEYAAFIFGVLWINFHFIYENINSSEALYLFHLSSNLGFLYSLRFANLSDNQKLFADLIICICVSSMHVASFIEFKMREPLNNSKLYFTYRVILSFALSLASQLFESQPLFLVVTCGVPLNLLLIFYRRNLQNIDYLLATLLCFFLSLYSSYFNSYSLHLLSCLILLSTVVGISINKKFFCFLGTLILFFSPFLQSSFFATIGTLFIFHYLSYLSYNLFKNSLLFPFVLSLIGILFISLGVFYQQQQSYIHEIVSFKEPTMVSQLLVSSLERVNSFSPLFSSSIQKGEFRESILIWNAPLIVKMTQIQERLVVGLVILFSSLLVAEEKLRKSFQDSSNRCTNVRLEACRFAQNSEDHGLELELSGMKPSDLEVSQVFLSIEGDEIWRAAGTSVPEPFLTIAKNLVLPLKLCPDSLDPKSFEKGRTSFRIKVVIGHKNPRVLHTTIKRQLLELNQRGNPVVRCVFSYKFGFFSTKKRLLHIDITPSEALRFLSR